MVTSFIDQEQEYLDWIAAHPAGYVVNHYRKPSAAYLKLHRATCRSISTDRWTNYTTRTYAKTCSDSRPDLERWARTETGGILDDCRQCNP